MVRPMIDNMQDDLPQRFREGIAAHVFKGDCPCHVRITAIAHPELPALVEGGPLVLEQREIAILRIAERCPWFCLHERQPEPIRGIDVREGVEHTFFGCLKIARQFFWWKRGGDSQQPSSGPCGVIELQSERDR